MHTLNINYNVETGGNHPASVSSSICYATLLTKSNCTFNYYKILELHTYATQSGGERKLGHAQIKEDKGN